MLLVSKDPTATQAAKSPVYCDMPTCGHVKASTRRGANQHVLGLLFRESSLFHAQSSKCASSTQMFILYSPKGACSCRSAEPAIGPGGGTNKWTQVGRVSRAIAGARLAPRAQTPTTHLPWNSLHSAALIFFFLVACCCVHLKSLFLFSKH